MFKELIVILVIALVVFGTKRLRNIGGDLGGAIKNFKDAMKDEAKPEEVRKVETIDAEVIDKTKHQFMFDVGFSELVLIAVVAMIVIGPERLPKVARTAGALLGRMQRYVNNVKSEVEREMQFEDLKKLHQKNNAK